jgi:hypothetical protein
VSDRLDTNLPSWNLYRKLLILGASPDEATALMNGYAYELAGRQRKSHDEQHHRFHSGQPCIPGVNCHARELIDLITPKAQTRPGEERTP